MDKLDMFGFLYRKSIYRGKIFLKSHKITYLVALGIYEYLVYIFSWTVIIMSVIGVRIFQAMRVNASSVMLSHYKNYLIYKRGKCFRRGDYIEGFKLLEQAANIMEDAKKQDNINDIILSECEYRGVFTLWGWGDAMGHITYIDKLIKLNKLGLLKGDKIVFNYSKKYPSPNRYFLSKFDDYVDFVEIEDPSAKHVPSTAHLSQATYIPLNNKTYYINHVLMKASNAWKKAGCDPLLTLAEAEVENGFRALEEIGLDRNKWFVTWHLRGPTSQFTKTADTTRNVVIDNYQSAIEYIAKCGGQVVFLGEKSQEYPHWLEDHAINYADSDIRSPELDIFVCAQNRFFLGVTTGITNVSSCFGKPAIASNVSPISSRPQYSGDMWVPKRYYCKHRQRYLTIKEMFSEKYYMVESIQRLATLGVSVQDNTEEDILGAVKDMIDFLDGKVQFEKKIGDAIDKADTSEPDEAYESMISPSYVKNNLSLFDDLL